MAIDRRFCLRIALAAGLLPLAARLAAQDRPLRLAASWELAGARPRLGVLEAQGSALRIVASIELPGRAHGLCAEADGSLLAVARRPGDWLLRWHPGSGAVQWQWADSDRAYTGHVLASADGRTLYTPQTDLDSGQGLIAVRDARTLATRAEWPTHGLDPHALVRDADGALIVANGGIATRPESGRRKLAQTTMDPSLVRLDARSGDALGQWRLDDPRLSIRHLAWGRGAAPGVLGIALQAEHDDATQRAAAPVLALFDGAALRAAEPGRADAATQPLAGYGGDIAALDDGFAVSCPRAAGGGVGRWTADGRWRGFVALPEACALASADAPGKGLWSGGREQALSQAAGVGAAALALPALKLDNHWLLLG